MFLPLKIAADPSFAEHLNQYDVIYLNIQHFMYDTDALENIGKTIQRLLLLDLKDKYGDYIIEEEMPLSSTLSKIHRETHGEKGGFIFIIDEWDCLFREAKNNQEVHKAYLDFLKNLFKDQIYVKLVYMTGILPIKKYGTHSALNIFDEYSMTDPSPLEQYVGFTVDEVKELCERFHMNFDEIKRWYDGYRFPEALHIYNPKSVVSAMTKKKFQSYWTRTETYEALSFYINMDFDGLRSLVVRTRFRQLYDRTPQQILINTGFVGVFSSAKNVVILPYFNIFLIFPFNSFDL
jgi:hypothetical protein